MSDNVIELSIAETNELRAKLGLKPLNVSQSKPQPTAERIEIVEKQQQHEQNQRRASIAKPNDNNDSMSMSQSEVSFTYNNNIKNNVNNNNEQLELSVHETNLLRAKLGLKPLNGNKEVVHAPPENEGDNKQIQERIHKEKLKRQVEQGILSSFGTETLAADSAATNDNTNTALSWALKMRAGASGNMEDTRNRDASQGNAKTMKKKKKKSVKPLGSLSHHLHEEEDLEGLHVGHALSDFEAGSTTILTLADAPLLVRADGSQKVLGLNDDSESGPQLENVDLLQNKTQQDRLRQKRQVEMGMGRAGGYAGFDDDEFEELGGTQAPKRMERGATHSAGEGVDDELARRQRGFKLGRGLQSASASAPTDLFAHEKGTAISLENAVANVTASDFMTAEEFENSLPKKKKDMKFKKKKTKKDKKNKRTAGLEDQDAIDEELPKRSILDELEQTAVSIGAKRKRRDDDDDDDNAHPRVSVAALDEPASRRARFDEIMEKGNKQSEAVFKPLVKETKVMQNHVDEEEPDDNFLNEALAKARRLRKLKELSTPKGADAVVQAVLNSNAQANNSEESEKRGGISFTVDETREFTRALRAREEVDERKRAKQEVKKGLLVVDRSQPKRRQHIIDVDVVDQTKPADMAELAKEIHDDIDDDQQVGMGIDGTATVTSVGRGMAGVLAMLRHTGEISGRNAGREELRGRAKDERTYEDYAPLDLKQVVRIGSGATEKDRELASREIKLDYRDEHGRLLTRKEAYRNLCYQFHGHGSSAKNEERRLRQIEREQSEARLASRQATGAGSLGALKATQKATGKAFVVHKV